MEKQSGRFKKKRSFTAVPNSVVSDPDLSTAALGLYTKIYNLVTRDNFTLYKSYLMTVCKEGERAFNTMWNELKNHGYLIQTKCKGEDGKWIYEYELLDEPFKSDSSNESVDNSNSNNTEKPDPQNVGVVIEEPGVRFAGVENAGVQNVGLNNKNVLNKTISNKNISSSSSSINTPREESTDQLTSLDDDDEKELHEITDIIFDVKEGKRLSSLPAKYGCDSNMIYPALKLALENRANKLVPYVNKIFSDWQKAGISHLSDLGIKNIPTEQQINDDLSLYQDQLSFDNENADKYCDDYQRYVAIFGPDKKYFKDKSKELRALAKIYPPHEVMHFLRDIIVNNHPINEGIDILMRKDRFEEDPMYRRYL